MTTLTRKQEKDCLYIQGQIFPSLQYEDKLHNLYGLINIYLIPFANKLRNMLNVIYDVIIYDLKIKIFWTDLKIQIESNRPIPDYQKHDIKEKIEELCGIPVRLYTYKDKEFSLISEDKSIKDFVALFHNKLLLKVYELPKPHNYTDEEWSKAVEIYNDYLEV